MTRQTPTTVVRGINDRLVAPGAAGSELLVTYAAAAAGSVFAVALAAGAGWPVLALIVIAVVAFDQFGGAVANATPAAKRRFHGPGRSGRHHLAFVAAHVQPFVLALAVPGFGWVTAVAVYGLVLAAALVVLAVPHVLRRPVAFATTVLAAAALTILTVPDPLAWFAPVTLIKLLLGHLLPGEESS